MLWAYFDESGEHDRVTGQLKTLTPGGCVADAAAWDALSVSWHAALNNAGVEMFHMTDFEADAGEFRGGSQTIRRNESGS
jgi:hypothetical protein